MKFQEPKGTKDIVGNEYYRMKYVVEGILKTMEKYGYRQVLTPGFEMIDLLEKDSGQEVGDQIYKFSDKGGREFGLRSDITPAVARIVANKARSWQRPIKIACYEPVYRYERPQKGRCREIYQINGEMFGAKDAISDAECITCFYRCYASVGLPEVKIAIGYRPILEEFVKSLGVGKDSVVPIMRLIDKRKKMDKIRFRESVVEAGLNEERYGDLKEYLELVGEAADILKEAKKLFFGNEKLMKFLKNLSEILEFLKNYGMGEKCYVDLGLSRGFDYYTGVIFEAVLEEGDFGSLGGGGRYDNLVADFGGEDIAAVGYSIGIERTCLAVEMKNPDMSYMPQIDYYVACDDKAVSKEVAIKLAEYLRAKDKNVETDLLNRYLSKQLKLANVLNSKYIILVKAQDLEQGKVVKIDVSTRKEEKCSSIEGLSLKEVMLSHHHGSVT